VGFGLGIEEVDCLFESRSSTGGGRFLGPPPPYSTFRPGVRVSPRSPGFPPRARASRCPSIRSTSRTASRGPGTRLPDFQTSKLPDFQAAMCPGFLPCASRGPGFQGLGSELPALLSCFQAFRRPGFPQASFILSGDQGPCFQVSGVWCPGLRPASRSTSRRPGPCFQGPGLPLCFQGTGDRG